MIRVYGIEDQNYRHHTNKLPAQDEVKSCRDWLSQFARKKSVNKSECIHSYGLKHLIERRIGRYVSNGACIQAAEELGFQYWVGEDSINANFYMELRLPENEWKRVRPGGFSKWLFSQDITLAEDAKGDLNWPRKASSFIDFWEYIHKYGDWVKESFCDAWEEWSGQLSPRPYLIEPGPVYEEECEMLTYGNSYPNAEEGSTYLYALFERVGKWQHIRVRYVGQSTVPSLRLKQHVLCPGSIRRVKWIAQLLEQDKYPGMAIIAKVSKDKANLMEKSAIYAFLAYENYWDDETQKFPPMRTALLNELF